MQIRSTELQHSEGWLKLWDPNSPHIQCLKDTFVLHIQPQSKISNTKVNPQIHTFTHGRKIHTEATRSVCAKCANKNGWLGRCRHGIPATAGTPTGAKKMQKTNSFCENNSENEIWRKQSNVAIVNWRLRSARQIPTIWRIRCCTSFKSANAYYQYVDKSSQRKTCSCNAEALFKTIRSVSQCLELQPLPRLWLLTPCALSRSFTCFIFRVALLGCWPFSHTPSYLDLMFLAKVKVPLPCLRPSFHSPSYLSHLSPSARWRCPCHEDGHSWAHLRTCHRWPSLNPPSYVSMSW